MSKLVRTLIRTPKAPLSIGPYNQAVKFNNVVYLSGVLGVDVKTNKLVTGGAAVEAKMVLTNMANILAAAGSGFDKVIKSTVMLNDINDFAAVNEVYKQFFTKDFPARSTFQVGKLPAGATVEIEAIAACGDVSTEVLDLSSKM
ncbi:2-iminobutanoate/2-iminopropanoate deaminase [Atheta coriaria]|uniref:2-iminobutanoate/2-iminopropanoate deaminase n=1 Tax=Dalotia coriaria TaxID=877792 RepID=UPI0031F44316